MNGPFLLKMTKKRKLERRPYNLKSDRPKPRAKGKKRTVEKVERSEQDASLSFVTTEKRYNLWKEIIKLRYWTDIGNQDAFDLEWSDAVDANGTEVEYLVKPFQMKPGKQPEEQLRTSLYTLTMYHTQLKIMIQGNYKDQWENDEFEKLRSIVSKVEEGNSMVKTYNLASIRK